MTNPDQEDELTTLERARAGLSPSPADAARVRASLAAALAAPGNLAPEDASSHAGQGLGTGGGWLRRVLVVSVAAAAMAGAGGYWMGYRAGAREGRLAAALPAVTDESAPPSRAGAVAGGGAPSPGPVSAPPMGDAPTAQEAIRRRPVTPARSGRPEVTSFARESLGQEVRALRAVEHALRDDDPRLALAILQQLDRDVPKGKLVEERRAMTVIARCSADDVPFGVKLDEDFASAFPESVYLARVEQACKRRSGSRSGNTNGNK